MLFEAGVSAERAQILLRHAQVGTTMDIYREIRAEKLGSMFEDVYGVDIS
jgi:site-specific recombinase XerD